MRWTPSFGQNFGRPSMGADQEAARRPPSRGRQLESPIVNHIDKERTLFCHERDCPHTPTLGAPAPPAALKQRIEAARANRHEPFIPSLASDVQRLQIRDALDREIPGLLDEVVGQPAGFAGRVKIFFQSRLSCPTASWRPPPPRPPRPPPRGRALAAPPGAGMGAFRSTPCRCMEAKRPGYLVKYITGSPTTRMDGNLELHLDQLGIEQFQQNLVSQPPVFELGSSRTPRRAASATGRRCASLPRSRCIRRLPASPHRGW